MAKASDISRLEALTDELEALLLKAPQSDFQVGAASTEDVRSLVNRQLFAKGLQRSAHRERSKSRVSELIQMASVLSTRATPPFSVRAVFGKSSTPSEQEIDDILAKFVESELNKRT